MVSKITFINIALAKKLNKFPSLGTITYEAQASRVKALINETAELLYPSVEKLVKEIVAVNHAWKVACELFGQDSHLSISSRDLKTCLQVRLLRSYAPEEVYLIEDKKAKGEPLYSLCLREAIGDRLYVEHLPMRIAEEVLTDKELKQFKKI
ncbi:MULTISPECIES: hypothetical protein [unclassified Nostoc]|uniref:hypothetical protein n=1 Tax=unclassified Nostoc TaxID=2593658 RepID=UPI002617EB81|nr:hypothetical protein [Nostoc sp. S13]MDF5738607.1 hypothetical protein [Nostoc sp. S13]